MNFFKLSAEEDFHSAVGPHVTSVLSALRRSSEPRVEVEFA